MIVASARPPTNNLLFSSRPPSIGVLRSPFAKTCSDLDLGKLKDVETRVVGNFNSENPYGKTMRKR
ncbi:MAG: hypothetical protein QW568_04085 [Candidatus Anstonellaceae archaeon]